MPRSGKRKKTDVEDEESFNEDEDLGAPMFSQLAPEASQSVKPESASDRKNLDKLDHETQEKFLASISRLILFSALEKEPIDRLKVIKDAGISSKDRIGSAAFQEASRRLQNVFGLQLNRIPKYMENQKGMPPRFKDRYYLQNDVKETQQGTHSLAIHSVHQSSCIDKGFVLLVNGLIFCKGESKANSSRKILERDLYKYLYRVDPEIPNDPPAHGTTRFKARTQFCRGNQDDAITPNVDSLLEQCVYWDYFIKEKATEENFSSQSLEDGDVLYSIGPRSALEIGRKQIIGFCASILDEEPDPSMLREVEEDLEDGEGFNDTCMIDGPVD